MNASFYRTRARQALKGKWKSMLLIIAVAQLLADALPLELFRLYAEGALFQLSTIDWMGRSFNLPTALGWLHIALNIVFFLLSCVVSVGIFRAMDALLEGETPRLSAIFSMKGAGKAIVVNLLFFGISLAMQFISPLLLVAYGTTAIVLLILVLVLLPVLIWVIFNLSISNYLLAQEPQIKLGALFRKSFALMKGNKWSYFCLTFSFIGWIALQMGLMSLLELALPTSGAVYLLVNFLSMLPLQLYIRATQAAFFRSIADGSRAAWKAYRREEEGSAADSEADVPQCEADAPAASEFDDVEAVAKELFLDYQCSHERMREAGVWEEYQKFNASSISENRWLREYGDALMRRFDQEPDALDALLQLISAPPEPADSNREYAMEEYFSRALQRIERHARQKTLPEEQILGMCERALALLAQGRFRENPGYADRKAAQIYSLADSLAEADGAAAAEARDRIREMHDALQ